MSFNGKTHELIKFIDCIVNVSLSYYKMLESTNNLSTLRGIIKRHAGVVAQFHRSGGWSNNRLVGTPTCTSQ